MKRLNGFSYPRSLVQRLMDRVSALKGRTGVVAARALVSRIDDAARAHSSQVWPDVRGRRSRYQIERGVALRAAVLADAELGYPCRCFGWTPGTRFDVVPITDLDTGVRRHIARIGSWWVRAVEESHWDTDRYSKSYHRQFGGVRTVDTRRVEFRRLDRQTGLVESRDVDLRGWRGSWALNAAVEAGVVDAVTVPARLRSVQLHRAYAIDLLHHIGGVEVYRRSLGGMDVDFVAVWHGLTFHASTLVGALHGLRAKLREIEVRQDSPIDLAFCRSLGFCEVGIRQFCADFGLDVSGRYSPDQVASAIHSGRDHGVSTMPYLAELRSLSRAVGREDLVS